jgi:hypothetical protein
MVSIQGSSPDAHPITPGAALVLSVYSPCTQRETPTDCPWLGLATDQCSPPSGP